MIKNTSNIEIIDAKWNEGLTSDDVQVRKNAKLDNPIKQGSSTSIVGIIFSELFTYFNIIYMIITTILIASGYAHQLTYLFVILPNLLIGIVQKIRSKLTIDKLSLLAKDKATVIRDGQEVKIDLQEIVRDDIIKVSTGQQIGSDSVVVYGDGSVNEAMLTGETLPIKKKIGDKLFGGSYVTGGTIYAKVINVGKDNYIQQLTSQAKRYKKPKSEILNSLNSIIKVIGILIIPISFLLFSRTGDVVKTAGAVLGMIPSGMFLLTSTALAVSVVRLSKNKALVQEIYCIEMLARVDMICMDKTGTITDGSMKVKDCKPLEIIKNSSELETIVGCMLSSVKEDNNTSIALKKYFKKNTSMKPHIYYAFTSDKKYFGVDYGDKIGTYLIGAPEYVCDMTQYPNLEKEINEQAKYGFRVLLCAHIDEYDDDDFNKSKSSPIGIIILQDNVRKDAIDTIRYFNDNNVAMKVISGDNPLTVSEVAKRAGIPDADKYISLQDVPLEEVTKIANEYVVFGRVSPQQKEILVKSLKQQEHTVAMIGDGVNDILALRESDCSVAIGAGSEAAKNVSHLILLDSNFSSMKNVIDEGRRCVNNLQNTSTMFLTKTFIAIILSAFCIATSLNYPFNPNQLLILEMFAIGIPAFFFALQPNHNIIKGKFFSSVMTKSFAQALTALIFCLPLYIFMGTKYFPQDMVETMIILIVTANSLIVLFRNRHPVNEYKTFVCITMAILSYCAFTFLSNVVGYGLFKGTDLYNFIGLTQLGAINYAMIIIIIMVMVPLQKFLVNLFAYYDKKYLKKHYKNIEY